MIVDALHCLFLGVVQRYCGHVIHQLLDHDVWQVGDEASEVRVEVSVLRLRDQLFGWYSDRERAGHRVYRVKNFTASMFPNSSCHMKGAETMCTQCRSVTLFCTLRTRPISSAIRGSTRRSRTSPRTDGSP